MSGRRTPAQALRGVQRRIRRSASALRVADARSILLNGRPVASELSLPRGVDGLLARNEHGRYAVPRESMHRPAAWRTLDGEVYEQETLRFVAEQSRDGVVVHAGTYFGDFLPLLSRVAAAVIAFEPNLINYECARATVWLNGLENVQLTRAALGQAASDLPMRVKDSKGRGLGGGSSLRPSEADD